MRKWENEGNKSQVRTHSKKQAQGKKTIHRRVNKWEKREETIQSSFTFEEFSYRDGEACFILRVVRGTLQMKKGW
jgi:hypothetical protein